MHTISRGKPTHSDKLEKWLGKEQVDSISNSFKTFYYPVPLHGVPGNVYIMPGGDFAGEIKAGQFMSKQDSASVVMKKLVKKAGEKFRRNRALGTLIDLIRAENRAIYSVGAFASIDAVVAAWTGGKGQTIQFSKTGVASNAIGSSNDMWTRAGSPGAGAAGSAAPGGKAWSKADNGCIVLNNGVTTDSNHYLNWTLTASVINNSLLLYDRLFSVAKTMNSTATEAVTGIPTRYQSTTSTDLEYIGGNFVTISNPTTVLAATAHNITQAVNAVWTYTNQAGTTLKQLNNNGVAIQTLSGISACPVGGIDIQNTWFIPLAAGDNGIKNVTQMQLSAAVATGTLDCVIGHPIAANACPIANMACLDDGLYTSMNLTTILDDAALAFIELPKPATTATNYGGLLRVVSE
jgi:hypothetical protein